MRQPGEPKAIPGNIQSMFTVGRSVAAKTYAREEAMLMLTWIHYPLSPLLTNDLDYLVTFIDASTWNVTTNGANQIISNEVVAVRIHPDGRVTPNGISQHTHSSAIRPPHKPRNITAEPITRLPDLDYVALAMAALPAEIDPVTRSRIMPFSCEVNYRKDGDPASGMKHTWVSLFDPRDIEEGKDAHNYQASGYGFLVKFDGTAIFRGRPRFGSSRFSEIFEQRKHMEQGDALREEDIPARPTGEGSQSEARPER